MFMDLEFKEWIRFRRTCLVMVSRMNRTLPEKPVGWRSYQFAASGKNKKPSRAAYVCIRDDSLCLLQESSNLSLSREGARLRRASSS